MTTEVDGESEEMLFEIEMYVTVEAKSQEDAIRKARYKFWRNWGNIIVNGVGVE